MHDSGSRDWDDWNATPFPPSPAPPTLPSSPSADRISPLFAQAGSSLDHFYVENEDLVGALDVSFEPTGGVDPSAPPARFTRASESDVDRRTTAVMAHAQLKGVVEDMCPGAVTSELETLDPLRLLDLGVDPERSVSLYRTLYKYARKCAESHERVRDAVSPLGPDATAELLHHVWRVYAATWESAAGAVFPAQVVRAKELAPDLARAEDAVNALVSELGETKDELAATTAARDDAAAEAASLRPLTTQLETQTTRARTAETERDEWASRARDLESRLAAAEAANERLRRDAKDAEARAAATEAALRAEMASVRAAGDETLAAEKRRAAEELAEPTSRLARWERERDAAVAGEKDAKKITGALRADIAFLREQRGGAEAEKQAALLRAREAEDREAKGAANAKAAKARADDAERRATDAETRADAAEERYATATARSLLLTSELAKSKKRVEALENSDVKQALSMALRRAEDAETTLEETIRDKEALVARVAELETLNEEANRERRAAARALKYAEAKVAELEGVVSKLEGEVKALEEALAAERETVAKLESRVAELASVVDRLEADVARLTAELEAETAARKDAQRRVREMRDGTLATTETAEKGLEKTTRDAEATATAATNGFDADDARWGEVEAEIAAFCEAKGEELDATETALTEWTGEVGRVASQAMDKANAAVDQLVKTTKELRETRAELSATIDELRMTKLDLGKTKEALESTSAELAKTKKELKASSERVFALEEQVAHVSAELESATANLTEMTKSRDEEREGRLTAEVAKSAFRMLKNKHQAAAETAVEELEDALEDLQTAKDGRAAANATAAQAKIRLGLLRRERGEREANRPAKDEPQPYVSDARIMDGTPEDLVPYQKTLTDEYHKASVALKREAAKRA